MARCLIIGCGCRGRLLARELLARGYAVRGTSRDPGRVGEIARLGAEGVFGDPDRVATLVPALEHVTIACLLLGSAVGGETDVRALHGSRLRMLLGRMLDSPVRAVVYEAAGTVDAEVLAAGVQIVRDFCETSSIPYAVLQTEPDDPAAWISAAWETIEWVLNFDPRNR